MHEVDFRFCIWQNRDIKTCSECLRLTAASERQNALHAEALPRYQLTRKQAALPIQIEEAKLAIFEARIQMRMARYCLRKHQERHLHRSKLWPQLTETVH